MMQHVFFVVGLSLILTHEMDAIRLQEWKMFVVLSAMTDATAYVVFTALHIPLYILLFWGLFAPGSTSVESSLVGGLNVFFVVHTILHLLFLKHPANQFRSAFSWTLIAGAGVAGMLDLLIHA